MIVQIKGVSIQIIASQVVVNEISIEFVDKKTFTVATLPKAAVDKIIDFGKVLYVRDGKGPTR